MALTTFTTAYKALVDEDKSPLDKLITVIPAVAMGLPALISGVTALGAAFTGATAAEMTFSAGLWAIVSNPVVLAIAAVVGAFVLLDKFTYTTSERLADANKELAESKKALAEAEEQANKASQAYENLVKV